jgi:hypothetical protein
MKRSGRTKESVGKTIGIETKKPLKHMTGSTRKRIGCCYVKDRGVITGVTETTN